MTPRIGMPRVPTSVEARFDEDGGLTPLAFQWQGQRLTIASWGRTWTEGEDGERRQHFLVMTAGERMFELVFAPDVRRWWMARAGSSEAWA